MAAEVRAYGIGGVRRRADRGALRRGLRCVRGAAGGAIGITWVHRPRHSRHRCSSRKARPATSNRSVRPHSSHRGASPPDRRRGAAKRSISHVRLASSTTAPLEIDNPVSPTSGLRSERQVEPNCFVEFGTKRAIECADQRSDALDIDRSNLLRLSFRIAWQPS